ncbi:replication factor-A carboxy-terminal domain protein [Senna tora]|uniref:Replication factor-A carboxy-terminal domain protein n=1 Tax=Senna tora TaxID=362788 RepID=A0A834WCV8_9FABA|nr:replication factor-A carboxy-terminal domain protein [Senna tora]
MFEGSNNLISSITPFREELCVKARVVRLWTKVQRSSDDVPIQYFGFDFVNLRSIRCGVVDSTILIDVIGLVRNISNIRRKFSENFQKNRIPIQIYDACGNVLQVVLCGIHCENFRSFIRNFSGGRIIVAVQRCKVADFHGSKYLITSMEATRLLINQDITRFDNLPVEFKQLDLKQNNFRNIHLSHVSSELSKETFADIQLNTISDLYISSEYVVHFIIATIIKVNTSMDWYYYACEFCIEELNLDDDCYYCYSCGKSSSTPTIRYKINVDVVDYTGWARLIILNPDASNFLMTDASKLLRRELIDDPLKHTNVLGNLVDKVFLFKIFVNEASCVPTPSFEVITMSWDASLIEKLSDKNPNFFRIHTDVGHDRLNSSFLLGSRFVSAEEAYDRLITVSSNADGEELLNVLRLHPLMDQNISMDLLGTYNGLIFLKVTNDDETMRLFICNPATKRVRQIQDFVLPMPTGRVKYDFGFNALFSSMYILVIYEESNNENQLRVMLYSCLTHTWTNINPPDFHTNIWESKSVCINGIMYWLSYPPIEAVEQLPTILRFDFADHIFSTISGPSNRPVFSYIPVEFEGSLAIICGELQGTEIVRYITMQLMYDAKSQQYWWPVLSWPYVNVNTRLVVSYRKSTGKSFISMDSINLTIKTKQPLTPSLKMPSTKRSRGHEAENEGLTIMLELEFVYK